MLINNLRIVLLFATCLEVLVFENTLACKEVYDPTDDSKLEYETEWVSRDFVNENGKRQLFCQVKNFCELLWYDNDTKEPIVVEDDFIDFEEHNQTLVIEKARKSDQRNYTCKASNDTHELEPRTTFLYVLDEDPETVSVGIPLEANCLDTTSDVGETVTFFCQYTATDTFDWITPWWMKLNETGDEFLHLSWLNDNNEKKAEVTTRYEDVYHRDKNDGEKDREFLIFNTTLYIHNISVDAFGLYTIRVTLDGGESFGEYNLSLAESPKIPVITTHGLIGVAAAFGGVLILSVSLALAYRQKTTEVKLCFKDCKNSDWAVEDLEYDVYISHTHSGPNESAEDIDFVDKILTVQLEQRGYNVNTRDINHLPGTSVHEEVVKSLDNSRRCILVISPAYMSSWIGSYDVNTMMDRMPNYKRQLIPIIYRDVSNVPELDGQKLLKHIMQDVKCLTWPEQRLDTNASTSNDAENFERKIRQKKETFFKKLMLRMPPLRLVSRTSTVNTNCSLTELTTSIETISETTPPTTVHSTPTIQNGVSSTLGLYPILEPDSNSNCDFDEGNSPEAQP